MGRGLFWSFRNLDKAIKRARASPTYFTQSSLDYCNFASRTYERAFLYMSTEQEKKSQKENALDLRRLKNIVWC